VLIGGLPGTGKSTLARGLAERADFTVIRTDRVRKELAGLAPDAPAPGAVDEGIYTPEMAERTYAECLRRAEEQLFDGKRVIVDASFGIDGQRSTFLELAARLCIPALLLVCRASPEVARQRIEKRWGDASDADVSVYEHAAKRWQEVGPRTRSIVHELNTEGEPERALAQAMGLLRAARLLD
jgi:predicted kinase